MANRIVIKITPPPVGDGLLRVSDAMLQVLDALKLFDEAETALGENPRTFEWRLERASTASPFTVTALAESIEPTAEISTRVKKLKSEVSQGLRSVIRGERVPDWMNLQSGSPVQKFFHRNVNGIGTTEIDFGDDDVLSIDRTAADVGASAIGARTAIDVFDLPEREASGEVEGVMVAAGRYRNQPAIQIRSELYGFVWCTLSRQVIDRFGTEHTMREVWEGKSLGVEGVLSYAPGGKLAKISVTGVREMPIVPLVDLDSVLDPNFTSGLSPEEYLNRLHEGELA
jgi:hypothetical protein